MEQLVNGVVRALFFWTVQNSTIAKVAACKSSHRAMELHRRSMRMEQGMSMRAPAPIRLVVADTSPVMRTGMISTIESEPQMKVVGMVAHNDELMPGLRLPCVNVLVTSLAGMGKAPVVTMRKIKQTHPCIGVVILAATADFAPELLAAGVHAYVSYEEPNEHLYLAIRAAKAQQTYLSPLVQDYVDHCTMVAAEHRLAPRELQIIKCIADGRDLSATASFMDMSYGTVKNYVSRIRSKTGWTTWPQMVTWYHTMYGHVNNASSLNRT